MELSFDDTLITTLSKKEQPPKSIRLEQQSLGLDFSYSKYGFNYMINKDFYKLLYTALGAIVFQSIIPSANALNLMPEKSDLAPEFSDFYIGIDTSYMSVNVASEKAHTFMATTRMGITVKPQVILEVQYSTSLSDDSVLSSDVEVNSSAGLYLRLVSRTLNDVTADISLGYASTEFKLNGRSDISEDFSSIVYGIGLNQHYSTMPHLSLRMDYKVLYNDDDITINALSLGFIYTF